MTDYCNTPSLPSLEQALEQILDDLPKPNGYQRLGLKKALQRIVYQDIHAAIDLPSFRNSAMDGYAFQHHSDQDLALIVIGCSWAGKPYRGEVLAGECIRVFTGAYVPDSCDCVVMQENTRRTNESIRLTHWPKRFENIRSIGSDIQQGQRLLAQGHRLKAADIGLLAACGIADIAVFNPITVGFFSTGDELISIGSQPELGQIYDSNRYTIHALLEEAGIKPLDMGVIADTPEAVEAALLSATKHCDLIITSGGVSVGEADFMSDVLAKIGQIKLWKMAIKPGKPLLFASINNSVFFGLPGNPVSVMVTFQQIVLPALHKMMGLTTDQPALTLPAIAAEDIDKQPGRLEFQRGVARKTGDELSVSLTGGQASHMLSSMSQANCLIILPRENTGVKKGQSVNIQLLDKHL
ncbi:molybdopterin molybdenumtransferase MoeA [Cycloclasticus sp. 46_120_T64]|nr:molybdopterin molybdenumtransferase MoeA [Cycloclasticus sp. 46_120_T64]